MFKKICLLTGLLCLLVSCAPQIAPPVATAPQKPLGEAPAIPYDTTDYPAMMDSLFAGAVEAREEELEYTVSDGKATLVAYKGNEKAVRIPSSVGGAPLAALADGAFAEKIYLEVLVLPDSITSVGKGILAGCTSLRALYTPLAGGAEQENAFLGYLFGAAKYIDNSKDIPPALEMVRFGPGVTSLGDFALYDCNDLIAVDGKGIKTLGTYAFYGCTNVKYLPLADLVTVGEGAMGGCSSLIKIALPQTVTAIGFGALSGCDGLYDLTLPFVGGTAAENTFLGYIFGAEVVDHAKDFYPVKLQQVQVLEDCVSLGNYAFFQCDSLRSITLPQGITSVGVRAFADCDALTTVVLPQGLLSIGENAFAGCDHLLQVDLGRDLKTIGVNAFMNCVSLTSITLPEGVDTIPASCFANCVSLGSVDLSNVKTVKAMAFHNCKSLHTLHTDSGIVFEKGNEPAEDLQGK